ncbi:MAG TPA: 3D domain-containing protein, partial [Saprospiraceae bacterium]|nr:3D domain-containing protein [Saprospiraceae bacterium]
GSVLLAAIPEFDKNGNCIGHQYRFLMAQDVGGQIGGPGHIDLYCGVGKEAQIKASRFHHYGRLWILLPKEQT